jgi:hypothetical protein
MEDGTKSYSEACNLIRHYSNLSFSVRILSFLHGLTLLSAWVLNFSSKNYLILFSIPSFGLFLTFLIYKFHKGYYDASGFVIGEAAKMEESLFIENFRPISSFKIYHAKKYKGKLQKLLILNAPFTFIGILFAILFLITIRSYIFYQCYQQN